MDSAPETSSDVGLSRHRRIFFPIILLVVLTLGFFADILLSSQERVLSHPDTDVYLQFIHWRHFGFEELGDGNLALWNPHIFSGTPYFGGFQSALLYPPNWLHLILPLADAINLGIALHVFLSGLFMFLWASHRGLHFSASLTAAVLFMFCGAHFLHVYAGHLANLCVIAWIPLLFLALDRLFLRFSLQWLLVGVLSVTMQILAGHPQYVFYTAIAAALYTALWTVRTRRPLKMLTIVGGVYLGAAALSAVQLLAGWHAASEGVRSKGLSYQMAAMLSFPPENLLTLLVPGLFGDLTAFPYWGRWYLWETSLFIGVSGIFLAIYGMLRGDPKIRSFSVVMASVLFILALGAYTPLFSVLYAWVPGFNQFRSNSKFILQVSLFLSMLAGIGLDALIRGPRPNRRIVHILLAVSVLFGLLGLWVYRQSAAEAGGWWGSLMEATLSTREVYLSPSLYDDPGFRRNAAVFASRSLIFTGATVLLLALLIFLARKRRNAIYLVAFLAGLEIVIFAASNRAAFDLHTARFPELEQFLEEDASDYRILFEPNPNLALSTRAKDLWGYDPGVLRRYAEFMAYTQGKPPETSSQYLDFNDYHPLYKMLRCRYFFIRDGDQIRIRTFPEIMPRLQLLTEYEVISDADEILAAMGSPDFDPNQTVILEESPVPPPASDEPLGKARIVESSTDHLVIEAELPSPALLLVTENYSQGWRAVALEASEQDDYTVLPANYTLQAVPLSAGRHSFRLEYLPRAFVVGKWVSVISLVIYALALLSTIVYKNRKRASIRKGRRRSLPQAGDMG